MPPYRLFILEYKELAEYIIDYYHKYIAYNLSKKTVHAKEYNCNEHKPFIKSK